MTEEFPLLGDEWDEAAPYRGALLIPVDGQGRILLQLRDHGPNTVHPGRWGLFGGGVEGGESLREAVIREFAEEVGVVVPADAPRPFCRILSTPGRRRLYVFSARLDIQPADISLGEGAGFGFVRPQDVRPLDIIPFARTVIERFTSSSSS